MTCENASDIIEQKEVKAIMYDYSNLLGAMRQRGITQKSLAKSIGKSEATINRKLCGAREFTQSEMFKILEIMGEPVERASFYFFTH